MNYGGIEVMLEVVLDRLGKDMTDPEKRAMSDAIRTIHMQDEIHEACMKQVPMQVVNGLSCPVCGRYVHLENYCSNCGQALTLGRK